MHAHRLVTECNSRKRDRLLRDRLRKRLGDLLDYQDTTHAPVDWEDIEDSDLTGPESTSLDLDALPAATRERVLQTLDNMPR